MTALRVRHGDLILAGDRWAADPARGTVVMLHGGGQTRHSWAHSAQALAQAGWTTLSVDLRGHGDSGWAPDRDYGLDAFVGDLMCLLESLEEPAVLVGASLGGIVSLFAAARSPERVRALVLVDVVVRLEVAGVDRIRQFMTARPEGYASLEEAAAAVAGYTPDRTRTPNPEGLRKNLRQGSDGRWHWHWDPAFLESTDIEARARLGSGELREVARQVRAPTLLLRGGRSDVVSSDGLADMLGLIPHAQAADVRDAGHMIAGDDNDVFTARVEEFLDQLAPLSGG